MGKKHTRIRRINLDVVYMKSIMNGTGFTITEPAAVSIDGTKKKSLYGPRSELYGTTYGDEQEFVERFRCECGRWKGRNLKGDTCPFCGKVVKEVGDNIKITGWISLKSDRIINPLYYRLLCSALGKQIFPDIITSRKKVDKDGNISNPDPRMDIDHPPLSPYSGIGIDEFRQRYYEIMDYFKRKRKIKADLIETLKKESRCVFTSHIPVYSTKLRQESITRDTYYYGGLDKQINPIINLSILLENASEIEKPNYLQSIQKKVNKIWNYNFDLLNGKDGIIRGQMLGGSLNYTSRNVICPDHTLHDNEIDMSYHTFLELFKERIIRSLIISEDLPISKANAIWAASKINFNQKIYNLMQHIVQHEEPMILLNRNPTLNYYSMLLLKIREVKPDFDDYTLSVPLAILPGLNADFDGDVLNIIGIWSDEIKYIFRKFNPVERMIMSRDTGLLNDYFTITKGQLIDLYYFAICDKDVSDLDYLDKPVEIEMKKKKSKTA